MTLRFILFFLLAPAFAIVAQAAGIAQDDFPIVDAVFQAKSAVLDRLDGETFNYDSSGALLQQRKSIDGENDQSGYHELEASGAERLLSAFLSEFVATNKTLRSYKSGSRMSDDLLFSKDRFARNVQQITESRRTISKADISTERLKFLGEDAVKIGPGKWRSLDGTRQFRVKPNDYQGAHGNIGPHAHFEFLQPNASGARLQVIKNVHVPLN